VAEDLVRVACVQRSDAAPQVLPVRVVALRQLVRLTARVRLKLNARKRRWCPEGRPRQVELDASADGLRAIEERSIGTLGAAGAENETALS